MLKNENVLNVYMLYEGHLLNFQHEEMKVCAKKFTEFFFFRELDLLDIFKNVQY